LGLIREQISIVVMVVLARCFNNFQGFLAPVNTVHFDIDRFPGNELVSGKIVLQSLRLNRRKIDDVRDATPDVVALG